MICIINMSICLHRMYLPYSFFFFFFLTNFRTSENLWKQHFKNLLISDWKIKCYKLECFNKWINTFCLHLFLTFMIFYKDNVCFVAIALFCNCLSSKYRVRLIKTVAIYKQHGCIKYYFFSIYILYAVTVYTFLCKENQSD